MNKWRIAAIAAACGLAPAVAHAQACFSWDYRAKFDRFEFSISYEMSLVNCTLSTATASGNGLAVASAQYEGTIDCDACNHNYSSGPAGDTTDTASAGGSVLSGTVSDTASASRLPFLYCDSTRYPLGEINFGLGALSGTWEQTMQSVPQGCKSEDCSFGGCITCVGSTQLTGRERGYSIGAFAVSNTVSPINGGQPYGAVGGASGSFSSSTGGCSEAPFSACCTRPPCNYVNPDIAALYVLVKGVANDGSTNERVAHAGLFVHDAAGSTHRLGFFSDSAFDPVSGTTLFSATDFPFDLSFSIDAHTLTISAVTDAFYRFDGDLDADGMVCPSDRAAMATARGSSIGADAYHPRGDFDMDGDVDADDYTLLKALPCTADMNCNSGHDTGDFTGFLTYYAAANMIADFDGSGALNVADFTAFTQAYAAGCP